MNIMDTPLTFTQIPTLYINLERRTDRNELIIQELKSLGMERWERMKAICMKNGAVGCAMSHIRCVEKAQSENWEYVFICEDDIQVLDKDRLRRSVDQFILSYPSESDWDVLIIGGNNVMPYYPNDDISIRVFHCITTTGYIVRRHYYSTLLANYKEGVKRLMTNGQPDQNAIDKYWLLLQRSDKWYMIVPPCVIQRPNFSDIEQRHTDFTHYMLNVNKAILPSALR